MAFLGSMLGALLGAAAPQLEENATGLPKALNAICRRYRFVIDFDMSARS